MVMMMMRLYAYAQNYEVMWNCARKEYEIKKRSSLRECCACQCRRISSTTKLFKLFHYYILIQLGVQMENEFFLVSPTPLKSVCQPKRNGKWRNFRCSLAHSSFITWGKRAPVMCESTRARLCVCVGDDIRCDDIRCEDVWCAPAKVP